jgi:hypothetical protein
MDTIMGMTREKAEAEVNKLGLSGQARAQKINELMGNTASKFEGTEEKKEQPKKKGSILKDIGTAMTNNQFGMGGAAMSNAQPTMQIKKEEQQSIDEIADATGLERDRGLLKGAGTIYSEDIAQDLKDRGVSVSDEYKAKHPEVYDENYGKSDKFQVGDNEIKKFNSGSSKGTSYASADDTKDYFDKNDKIASDAEDKEYDRQGEKLEKRWNARLANMDKMTQSMKNIDDHMVEQLPTFMIKRYANGEFGDPKSSDAKLRLTHFLLNGVQSKLKNASNAAMIAAGKSPMFADTTSDYEKYQQTNFAQGLENRWNKYKQETQSAIDLAKKGGMSEEAITDSIATISSNNRLQSAFNMMNERQKVYALNVLGELGGKLGNMNDSEFANTLMAMAYSGDSLDYKEAAGMLIYRFMKDPEKRNAALSELGFNVDGNSKKSAAIKIGKNLIDSKK